MNKIHENKLTMYLGVKAVLENNAGVTSAVPALGTVVGKFNSTIGTIQAKAKEFDLAVTGKAQVKQDAEDELIDALLPAAGCLAAYAHTTKSTELLAKATVTDSTFRRLRDTEIVTKAKGLLELIQGNAAKLGDYGVTADSVTELNEKIDAYAAALGQKESGYSDRASLRKALFDLFDEADTILDKQMDPIMEQFKKRETEFYDSYSVARSIKDIGMARKQKVAAPLSVPGN